MPRRAHRLLASISATLVLALVGGAALSLTTVAPAQAAVFEGFQKVYSANVNGEISLVGNTLMTCLAGSDGCAAAQTATGGAANNNNFNAQFVDVDADSSTFNSSSARLTVPDGGSVLFAALVWGGRTQAAAATHADPALRQNVRLTVPNGTGTASYDLTGAVSAESPAGNDGIGYQGYVDVTDQVSAAGSGVYSLANVQSVSTGANRYAGWSLVVAMADADAPMRNLTVFKGLASLSNSAGNSVQTLTVDGFLTPPAGAVKTTLGAVTYEGDRGLTGDSLTLDKTTISDQLNPADNIFNSTISNRGQQGTGRIPQYGNQLGFDVDLIRADGILPNNATSATLTLRTGGEQYYPGVVTFSTELYDPKLYGTKTATLQNDVDGDGLIDLGDTVRYSVALQNIGLDTADESTFFDAIPTGTRYVADSLTVDGHPLTDASADDAGEYVSTGGNGRGHVLARVGEDAGAADGGAIPTYDTNDARQDVYTIAFDVVVDDAAPGQGLVNAASLAYRGQTTLVRNAAVSNAVVSPVPADPGATNRPPTARDYTLSSSPTVAEPTTVVRPLLDSTDPDGDAIRLVGVTDAAGGPVVVNPDGSISYTPRPEFAGRDVFTYTVEDAAGNRSTGVIRVDVVNAAPVATDDVQDVARSRPTPVSVLANDTDGNGDALAVRGISAAGTTVTGNGSVATDKGGTVTLLDGVVTYTPPTGGLPIGSTDTFGYVVSDSRGASDGATVIVTAQNAGPIAHDDAATIGVDGTADIRLFANDSDPDGDALEVSSFTQPTDGKVAIDPDGTAHYTPHAGFAGSDSFSYTVSDGHGGTASAKVVVKVDGPPVTAPDDASTAGDTSVTIAVLDNDTDPNGDPLTATVITAPAHGTATAQGDGTIVYSPAPGFVGDDSFVYTASDGTGRADGTVTVTVANVPPTANPESATTATEAPVTVKVLGNDTDPNVAAGFQSLTVIAATADQGAEVVRNADGTLTLTPAPGFSGPVVVEYTIFDGIATASTRLTVTVSDAAPVALPDSASTPTDTPVLVDALENDSDANTGTVLTITSVGTPVDRSGRPRGSAGAEKGRIRFTPDAGWAGTVTFDYAISDGAQESSASVTVVVENALPVAKADAATTPSHTAIDVDVLGNDSDANIPATDQKLSVATATADHGAEVEVLANGRLRVTPTAGFRGEVTVSYTVTDGAGGTATSQLVVTVQNAAPVAANAPAATSRGTAVSIPLLANVSDVNGDTLSVTSVSEPVDASGIVRGVVTVADGVATFTPTPGFAGRVTFTYTVSDGVGGVVTQTATVDVLAVPAAGADTAGAPGAPAPAAPHGGPLASTGGTIGAALPIAILLLIAGIAAVVFRSRIPRRVRRH